MRVMNYFFNSADKNVGNNDDYVIQIFRNVRFIFHNKNSTTKEEY